MSQFDGTKVHYSVLLQPMNNAVPADRERCMSRALGERLTKIMVSGEEKCSQCLKLIPETRFHPPLTDNVVENHGSEKLKAWWKLDEKGRAGKPIDLKQEFIYEAYICATWAPPKQPNSPEPETPPGCMGIFCLGCAQLSLSSPKIQGHLKREATPPQTTTEEVVPSEPPQATTAEVVPSEPPQATTAEVVPPEPLAQTEVVSYQAWFCCRELRQAKPRIGSRRAGGQSQPVAIDADKNSNLICAHVGCSRKIWDVGKQLKEDGRCPYSHAEIDAYHKDVAQCESQACLGYYCFQCYQNQKWGSMDTNRSSVPDVMEKMYTLHYPQHLVYMDLLKTVYTYLREKITAKVEKDEQVEKRKRESSAESEGSGGPPAEESKRSRLESP